MLVLSVLLLLVVMVVLVLVLVLVLVQVSCLPEAPGAATPLLFAEREPTVPHAVRGVHRGSGRHLFYMRQELERKGTVCTKCTFVLPVLYTRLLALRCTSLYNLPPFRVYK